MSTIERFQGWRDNGVITPEQYNAFVALVRKQPFSVFLELNALLYLGVLSIIAGVGWLVKDYAADFGDAVILSFLTALLFLCFYYCFSNALPYSSGEVESPNLAFDYILYLGCLTLGVEIGYIESRFHLLQTHWDFYLLCSTGIFFALAYRFDNRFVLSLALSALAGWFGIRISQFSLIPAESLRHAALIYGAVVAAAGGGLYRSGIKRHFTETYLHVASNILFIALLSGVSSRDGSWLYLMGLVGLSGVVIVEGLHFRRFAFVVYGVVYSYIGISRALFPDLRFNSTAVLSYFVVSGSIVIVLMILLARRLGREE